MENNSTEPNKPTRKSILSWFKRQNRYGADTEHLFRTSVSRWIKCGYPLEEIPHLFSVTQQQLDSAIAEAYRPESFYYCGLTR